MDTYNSKGFGTPIIRGFIAILVGLITVIWPGYVQDFIVKFIGIALMVSGAVSFIIYFSKKKKEEEGLPAVAIPFGGIVSFILGLIMVIKSAFFMGILLFLLGFLLIIGALGQFMVLLASRRTFSVPPILYLFPSVVFICGIIIIFNPFASAIALLTFFGAVAIFYGVVELIETGRFEKR